jgi:hypothetical protein
MSPVHLRHADRSLQCPLSGQTACRRPTFFGGIGHRSSVRIAIVQVVLLILVTTRRIQHALDHQPSIHRSGSAWASSRAQAGQPPRGSSGGSSQLSERKRRRVRNPIGNLPEASALLGAHPVSFLAYPNRVSRLFLEVLDQSGWRRDGLWWAALWQFADLQTFRGTTGQRSQGGGTLRRLGRLGLRWRRWACPQRGRRSLLDRAWIAAHAGQIGGHCRGLAGVGGIVVSHKSRRGLLELARTAVTGVACVRENLRRRFPGVEILGVGRGGGTGDGDADHPLRNSAKLRHDDPPLQPSLSHSSHITSNFGPPKEAQARPREWPSAPETIPR